MDLGCRFTASDVDFRMNVDTLAGELQRFPRGSLPKRFDLISASSSWSCGKWCYTISVRYIELDVRRPRICSSCIARRGKSHGEDGDGRKWLRVVKDARRMCWCSLWTAHPQWYLSVTGHSCGILYSYPSLRYHASRLCRWRVHDSAPYCIILYCMIDSYAVL